MKSSAILEQFSYLCRKRTSKFTIYLVVVLLLVNATPRAESASPGVVPGEYIVQLNHSLDSASLSKVLLPSQTSPSRLLSQRLSIWLIKSKGASITAMDKSQLMALSQIPEIVISQPNRMVQSRTTPNDASFSQQWNLNNTGQGGGTVGADISAIPAWDIGRGQQTSMSDEIVVAVVDDGFDLAHGDLNFHKNRQEIQDNGVDDDNNGYIDDYNGWNVITLSDDLTPHTHGTHVSGIVGALTNNGTGVAGVGWGTAIMPIHRGSFSSEAWVIAAYSYALEMRALYNETAGQRGAYVVATNSSFGIDLADPLNYPIWCSMYDALGEVGILSAAATANLNVNVDIVGDMPTACQSEFLLSVTNTTKTDVRNSGAAYGKTTIDLGAPGTSILSTIPGSYGNLSGCSMAAPHVAGAVAVVYSALCTGIISESRNNPASAAKLVRDIILESVDKIPSMTGETVTGGRLNLYQAALAASNQRCGLSIVFDPLPDTNLAFHPILATCNIASNAALDTPTLKLHFSTSGQWDSVPLTASPIENEFGAPIPPQPSGTTVAYYFSASNLDDLSCVSDTAQYTILEYGVAVGCESPDREGAYGDTISFFLTIRNRGTKTDRYTLGMDPTENDVWIVDHETGEPLAQTRSLMADEIDSCSVRAVVVTPQFGVTRQFYLGAQSYLNSDLSDSIALSITSDGDVILPPLVETFPSTQLDASRWSTGNNTLISSIGINPPSGPFSITMDGNPSGGDTLTSCLLDLSDSENMAVNYYFQETGMGESPDAGNDLILEFRDSLTQWHEIARLSGAIAAMTQFESATHYLPSQALHNRARIRFRNLAKRGNYDYWMLDDIRIGSTLPPVVTASLSKSSIKLALGGATSTSLIIRNDGEATLTYQIRHSKHFASVDLESSIGVVGSLRADSVTIFIQSPDTVGILRDTIVIISNAPLGSEATLVLELSTTEPITVKCGDANNDAIGPNVVDLVYLVSWLFGGGSPLPFPEAGDVNASGGTPNIVDLSILVGFLFKGTNSLSCPNSTGTVNFVPLVAIPAPE